MQRSVVQIGVEASIMYIFVDVGVSMLLFKLVHIKRLPYCRENDSVISF